MYQFIKRVFYAVILSCLLFSCSDDYLYQEHQNIANEKWTIENKLPFTFNVDDTTKNYGFGFVIRYTEDYSYQNLYLFLQTTFPNGLQTKDTILCRLFAQDGKPFGKGNRVKELKINYNIVKFPMKGEYTMEITHAMRQDTLDGITSMGIFILPIEKNNKK